MLLQEDYKEIFDFYCSNQSRLNYNELETALLSNDKISDKDINQIIREANPDSNGYINIEEFANELIAIIEDDFIKLCEDDEDGENK